MEFAWLDEHLSGIFNLEEGSVFVLKPKKSDNLFEFIYPAELKGRTVPLMSQGIMGKIVVHKSPLIVNDFQGEMDIVYLNSSIMETTNASIRKMIVYPICLARQICVVLLVVRKDHDSSDFQNFIGEDLQKIKLAVDNMIYLQLVKSA